MPRRFTRNAWRESTNRQKKICKNGCLEMCGLRNYLGILHRTYFGAMKFKERLIFVTCLILIILPFLWLHIAEYQERQLEESERTIRLLKVEDKYDFNSMEHGHSLSKDSNVLKTQNKDNKVGENIQNGQKSNVDTGDLKSKNKRSTDEKRKPKDEDEDDEIEADDAWLAWKEMVNFRTLTPSTSEGVNTILDALTFKPVVAAGIGYKGTQLKATLLLEGKQKVVFKPMRYPRDFIIEGKPYDGYDRHNGEIAAFHLDRILGFNRAPPVAGRKINLEDDIEPIAERNLLKTFFKKDGNTCFYGVCLYCKKSEPACANKTIMEGSVTVWLPQEWALAKWRHPWQRTYRNGRKAKWEVDNNYCKKVVTKHPYDEGPRLLDIIDTAIFDFLIGNADRHHYEVLKKGDEQGVLVHLDNAKSFGNPNEDEITILAPLYQCCRVRRSTWDRLYEIANNESKKLSEMLKASTDLDALSPILTDAHLEAVDRRLSTVMNIGKKCIDKNGKTRVLKDDST